MGQELLDSSTIIATLELNEFNWELVALCREEQCVLTYVISYVELEKNSACVLTYVIV